MLVKNIHTKIHEIHNQKVMLDFDLAILYEIETRVLNQAVKRNLDRYPEDFNISRNDPFATCLSFNSFADFCDIN